MKKTYAYLLYSLLLAVIVVALFYGVASYRDRIPYVLIGMLIMVVYTELFESILAVHRRRDHASVRVRLTDNAVSVPPEILQSLHVANGDELKFINADGTIVVEKSGGSR